VFIIMPHWPAALNWNFDGAMGKRACPLVIVVRRWPCGCCPAGLCHTIGLHLRLVVEQIHLRRPADHVQIDHALGLRRELRAWRMRVRCIGQGFAKQRSQRRAAEDVFPASEELTTGLIGVPFLEEVHGGRITC
jgi:hypothetical protein